MDFEMLKRIPQKLFLLVSNKKFLIFCVDLLMVPIALFVAYWTRYNLETIPNFMIDQALQFLPLIMLTQAACNLYFGIYRGVWRFASLQDINRIIKSVLLGTTITLISFFIYNRLSNIPRSVLPLYAFFLISLLGGLRMGFRWLREKINYKKIYGENVLIIGAGEAGELLMRELYRNPGVYNPIGFIDDNKKKRGQEIHGVPVLGDINELPQLVSHHQVNRIFIATPSAASTHMRRIVNACESVNLPFSTLPSINDLTSGRVGINDLRDVCIEDLLGREQVSVDWAHIKSAINHKVILVTGGGGSIGSELCRQIANLSPQEIIIVDNCEFNLYQIQKDLQEAHPGLNLTTHLACVTDETAIRAVFHKHKPKIIFHAAAYKHVPMLENKIRAAVRNNILGTRIVSEAAVFVSAEKFILISTDKAVNPTNIMGTSKRVAEIFCQNYNNHSNTQFITVRFGNVLDSAGSVVPLFRSQLKKGGPLTVTHPEVTRYFMTIPEASQLILQATTMGKGGEIYVLDMGEPIKIRYLAEQMIQLSGKQIDEDIKIIYTGLRPGEKLFEELLHEHEQLLATLHKKILMAKHRQLPWDTLVDTLDKIHLACQENSEEKLLLLMMKLVPEFTQGDIPIVLENASDPFIVSKK